MADASSPLQYLTASSTQSLEAFELTRLNCAANLRKQLIQLIEDWIRSEVEAYIARWMIDRRRAAEADAGAPHSLDPAPVPQLSLDLSEVFGRDSLAASLRDSLGQDVGALGLSLEAPPLPQSLAPALPAQADLPLFPEANALCSPTPSDSDEACANRSARPTSEIASLTCQESAAESNRIPAATSAPARRGKTLLRFAPGRTRDRVAQVSLAGAMKCAVG